MMRTMTILLAALIAAGAFAAEIKKPSANTNELNPFKSGLIAGGVVTALVGASFNGMAFAMGTSINNAHSLYTTATSDFEARWNEYDGMRIRANVYTITAFSCYAVAAGLILWGIITPDTMPTRVSVMPMSDGLAVSFAQQF